MVQRAKVPIGIAAGLVSILLVPLLTFVSGISSASSARPLWPKNRGVFVATSSETIPLFPRALSGYRFQNNKDYWNHPFESSGSIRVFKDNGWTEIPDFPHTMNHCSDGVFMIRWRSSDPDVRVATNIGYSTDVPSATAKIATFGYMYGTNCEEPLFKFAGAGNNSTLADIYYELKFWRAAP